MRFFGLILAACLVSCTPSEAVKHDVAPVPITSRVYARDLATLRAAVLHKFDSPAQLPEPFSKIKARPVDESPGDLLLEEPTGDYYWPSEYVTGAGPVKFRCGFLLHFTPVGPGSTEIQVFEKYPEIWVGEQWAFAHHGIGFGRFHDIREVEPTVKERLGLLDLIGSAY